MILTIAASAFVFGLLVLFHEFGHFITAKMTGMRVDEFAIGFGPRIISFQRGETLYSLRAIPLGGFNDIAGMEPSANAEAGGHGYLSKPVWARMIVISAGALMNFILPIFIFWGIFAFAGISSPSPEPVLGEVLPNKPAYIAGLRDGDRIIRIDGQEIDSWKTFVKVIAGADGKIFDVEYQRDGEMKKTRLIPEYDKQAKRSLIGVISASQTEYPGFIESGIYAVQKTGFIIYKMLEGLLQLITGRAPSAEIAGPIGVAQMAGEVAHLGFLPLLNFAALLSLNLGVINMLPVPALDGGHFLALVIEFFRGKPMSEKMMHNLQMFGITILIALMLFATKNDIVRLFFG